MRFCCSNPSRFTVLEIMFILKYYLEKILKYKKIYIESLKRISGTPGFVVELPETVQHEITIPHSWYGISRGYNGNFDFYQNDTVNEDYRQFALRQGLNTSDQLDTEIKYRFNGQYDVNGRTHTFSVSFLNKENQTNIVCNSPSI